MSKKKRETETIIGYGRRYPFPDKMEDPTWEMELKSTCMSTSNTEKYVRKWK